MTQPRCILPGTTYHLIRRCYERRFLMRPDPEFNDAFFYLLALGADKFGLLVHQATAMHNHGHWTLTDPDNNICRFQSWFFTELSKVIRHLRGRRGPALEASKRPELLPLVTEKAIIDTVAYGFINPVKHAAVHRPEQWPGVCTTPEQIGRVQWTLNRPGFYFKNETLFPRSVKLRLRLPPSFEGRGHEFRTAVRERAKDKLRDVRQRLKEEGRSIAGVDWVLSVSPNYRPKHEDPPGLTPQIVACDSQALRKAKKQLRAFRSAYREAWARWKAGARKVVFPSGSWMMGHRYHARCGPPCAWLE